MKLKIVSNRKKVTFSLQRQDQGWRRLAVLEETQEKMNNPPTSPTWNKMPQRWQWRKSDVYNQTKTIPALKPMLKFGNFIQFMRLDKRKKRWRRIFTVPTQLGRPPFRALTEMKYRRLFFLPKETSHQLLGDAEKYQIESRQFRLSQLLVLQRYIQNRVQPQQTI